MTLPPTVDKRVTIIAAVAENRAIGANNALLYSLPNDLRRFKLLTTGHTIIMGRRTFLSLPHGALPNRRNIVLSTTAQEGAFPGCEQYRDLPAALAASADDDEIFIIGGGQLYAAALPFAEHIALTIIHATPSFADTFFPALGEEWQEQEREDHPADARHAVSYSFLTLSRR